MAIERRTAILGLDIQNDFCPKGALAVKGGHEVVPAFNQMIKAARDNGYLIILGRDWHKKNSIHFATNSESGRWPEHCIEGTYGAEFHPDLDCRGAIIVSKGVNPLDSSGYSGFECLLDDGQALEDILKGRGITRLLIGGLSTDYGIKETAIEAVKRGFKTYILEEAIRAVNLNVDEDGNSRSPKLPDDEELAIAEMLKNGVKMTTVRWEVWKAYHA